MANRHRNGILTIYITSFLGQLSMAIINLGLIFFMRSRFALEAQYLGIFVSLCPIMYLIGLLLLKRLVYILPPVITIMIASSGMVISGMLILAAGNVGFAFVLYGVYGLFMSIFWPPIMGLLSRGKEGGTLGKSVASFNLAWSSGIIIGPYIAGALTEFKPQYAIVFAGAAMLLIFLIMAAASRRPAFRGMPSSRRHVEQQGGEDHSSFYRFLCWLGIIAAYFVFGVTMNIFPVYANEILGFPESNIGLFLLVRGLVTTVVFVYLGRTHFWHFRIIPVIAIQLLLIIALVIGLTAVTAFQLVLFFILFGIAFSGIYTNSIFHGVAGSLNRESRMALHELFLTVGMVAGSLSGGYLYQHNSYAWVLRLCIIVSGIIGVLQIGLYIYFCKRGRTTEMAC